MDYFPLFMKVKDRRVLMVGDGSDVVHKLKLMLKTSADITVFGTFIADEFKQWHDQGLFTHHSRMVTDEDTHGAAFAYIDGGDISARDAAIRVFDRVGLPYCVIDDKARSQFITPALVDRDPMVIAIGSEGTAPVIARDIKASIEAILPQDTGAIARAAGAFRDEVDILPRGAARRRFWTDYIETVAPQVIADCITASGDDLNDMLTQGLTRLLHQHANRDAPTSSASLSLKVIIGDDADLLTRQALRVIHDADVVAYDLKTPILELARREADLIAINDNGATRRLIDGINNGHNTVLLSNGFSNFLDRAELFSAGIYIDELPHITFNNIDQDNVIPMMPNHVISRPQYLRPQYLRKM
ncbi:MAG: NAD(P)-dependent oxidoreductase [Candidatus Puniceispirillales bacterium WSBS_2018_MAG_OTU23]